MRKLTSVIYLAILGALLTAGTASADDHLKYETINYQVYQNEVKRSNKLYYDGKYEEAFPQLSKTARWGDKESQYLLGAQYLAGDGVEPDVVTGLAWTILANESGDNRWRNHQIDVEKQLQDATIEKANELAEQLRPYYGMEATDIQCRREAKGYTRRMIVRCDKTSLSGNHQNYQVLAEFPL